MATKNTTITVSVAGSQNYLPASKTINVSNTLGAPLTDIVTSSKIINNTNPIIIYDENSLWKGEPIEWQVIGIDQDGNNTVTLQTNKVLTGFAWDSMNNGSNTDRNSWGANRIDSLAHQWLNSNKINWYSSQHNNQAPSSNTIREYDNWGMNLAVASGFMTNLGNDFKSKLISVTKNITPYYSDDPSSFTGKLFYLSIREVDPTRTDSNYIQESNAFTYQRFQNNSQTRRKKEVVDSLSIGWLLRSPQTGDSTNMWVIYGDGSINNGHGANSGSHGLAPACVIPSNIMVEKDVNGKYKIIW